MLHESLYSGLALDPNKNRVFKYFRVAPERGAAPALFPGMVRRRFDILRHYDDGSFAWIESTDDLSAAQARLRELSAESSNKYVIFDHGTQQIVATNRATN